MTREEALRAYEEIRKEKVRLNWKFYRGQLTEWEHNTIRGFQNALMRKLKQEADREEVKRQNAFLNVI